MSSSPFRSRWGWLRGAGGSRRSPCRASAQRSSPLSAFYCLRVRGVAVPVAMAVCSRPYAFHQRVYFAGWAGAALCHHRVWRPADCHLHHAGVSLYDQWYQQPVLLLLGAIWYNLLTLTGHLIFPVRPLQDNLARSYEQLAHYLELKSRLFDPDIEEESQLRSTIWLWRTASLSPRLTRQKRRCLPGFAATVASEGRAERCTITLPLRIFMNAPARLMFSMRPCAKFRYSDVMFRFQRLLSMQSRRASSWRAPFCCARLINTIHALNACSAILMRQLTACEPAERRRSILKRWDFCSITCGRLMLSWQRLNLNRPWRCRAMRRTVSSRMTACTVLAICGSG